MNRTIAVVCNAVRDDSLPDEQDVLVQAEAVRGALDRLGYRPMVLACGLNLAKLVSDLNRIRPLAVFNLAESLDGHGRLIHVVPAVFDALGFAYTGCPAEVILATSHKVMAKERMKNAGLPTPDWINPVPAGIPWKAHTLPQPGAVRRWIIKSLWEHASLGLEEDCLVVGTADAAAGRLAAFRPGMGGACFAEAFVSGREFNLSLIETRTGPRVLPPAEICFQASEYEKPRIVGYRAKWVPDSDEWKTTPRSFDFPEADRPLLSVLESLALGCWRLFGLRGYARVDFRVDPEGRPFILEINANPCISPDAGFAAALQKAGISYDRAVESILHCGLNPSEST